MRARYALPVLVAFSLVLIAGAAYAQGATGDPERGGRLFIENCAVCHGENGQGRIGANLDNFAGIEVSVTISQTIRQGVPGSVMPAWGQANGGPLSDQDIADITAYIIGAFGGTEPLAPLPTYQPPVIQPLPDISGDPSAGAAIYQANCVMCHGEEGQGRIGRALAKEWPANQPAVYIAGLIRDGVSGSPMPAWEEGSGGPLTEKQIEDVTSYILTLSPVDTAPTPIPPAPGPISLATGLIVFGAILILVVIGMIFYYRRA
jgi:ubiquinol-cytochrome c reductase cytochrome c subunit